MRRARAPWWIYLWAASFLGYFSLLVWCDLWRPDADGLALVGGAAGLIIQGVGPGSAEARAGLRPGDEILVADGHPVDSRVAWMAVESNLRFDRPLSLDVRRGAQRVAVAVPLRPAPWSLWWSRWGVELLVTRLVQLVTLGLGLVVVFRRPSDPVARLAAWLLCAFGVVCIVMPFRVADVWRRLPLVAAAPLWLPFASTRAIPALLLSFFLVFPRRSLSSPASWVAAWLPMTGVLAVDLRFFLAAVYRPDIPRYPDAHLGWFLAVSIGYLAATAGLVLVKHRRAVPAERRRLRVLLLGGGVGCAAGGPIALLYWRAPHTTLYASPAVAVATLLLLVVPLSFAYAILRHRLFDVRFMVRQGVRYALARGLLLSVVPVLGVVLAADVYLHRDRAIGEWFGARASLYLAIAVGVLVAQLQRRRWLEALDRRFFRERYDAQRLLERVVSDLAVATGFATAASRAVDQIEAAIHPRFVTILTRAPGDETFRMVATSPEGAGPPYLAGGARLVAVARLLGKPLDVSAGRSAWLSSVFPPAEAALVAALQLEIVLSVAPASGGADGLLVLGGRRSDEPYDREAIGLLESVGRGLSDLLSRDQARSGEARGFAECPACGACHDLGADRCERDGDALAPVALPRLLAGRYRLDGRLARGGMGVVYAATDLSLAREVAVKVLRADLVGSRESVERFQREARISASFAHPHVVRVYDFGIAGETQAFLVMERLRGRTLREELDASGALGPRRARAILQAVCAAVGAAHRRQLVHRDLKPENIILASAEGGESPKVLDFGIAKMVRSGDREATGRTTVGSIVGTPQYMAPEQARGDEPAPSWDVWALAVIAFELLTGAHPFARMGVGIAGSVPVAADPRPGTAAGLGPAWQRFFARALALNPRERSSTAAELLSAFDQALEEGEHDGSR
jgi:tRNA A-37 threonylcarbamoyl transferase component Bud32